MASSGQNGVENQKDIDDFLSKVDEIGMGTTW